MAASADVQTALLIASSVPALPVAASVLLRTFDADTPAGQSPVMAHLRGTMPFYREGRNKPYAVLLAVTGALTAAAAVTGLEARMSLVNVLVPGVLAVGLWAVAYAWWAPPATSEAANPDAGSAGDGVPTDPHDDSGRADRVA
ncbi:hypothetical protein ACFYWP_39800 [Actinacidiphila glaucinigra]|uniref:hypothetical protein n=1 Tax=Actinacidiphila glaucinigra TaxID=235986 RepID=UPI00367F9504